MFQFDQQISCKVNILLVDTEEGVCDLMSKELEL